MFSEQETRIEIADEMFNIQSFFRGPGVSLYGREKESFAAIIRAYNSYMEEFVERRDMVNIDPCVQLIIVEPSSHVLSEVMSFFANQLRKVDRLSLAILKLLEEIVRRGDRLVHQNVSSDELLGELLTLYRKQSKNKDVLSSEISSFVLKLIQEWGERFAEQRKLFPEFTSAYMILKRDKAPFPPFPEQKATTLAAKETSTEPRSQATAQDVEVPAPTKVEAAKQATAAEQKDEDKSKMLSNFHNANNVLRQMVVRAEHCEELTRNSMARDLVAMLKLKQGLLVDCIDETLTNHENNCEDLLLLNDDVSEIVAVFDDIASCKIPLLKAKDIVVSRSTERFDQVNSPRYGEKLAQAIMAKEFSKYHVNLTPRGSQGSWLSSAPPQFVKSFSMNSGSTTNYTQPPSDSMAAVPPFLQQSLVDGASPSSQSLTDRITGIRRSRDLPSAERIRPCLSSFDDSSVLEDMSTSSSLSSSNSNENYPPQPHIVCDADELIPTRGSANAILTPKSRAIARPLLVRAASSNVGSDKENNNNNDVTVTRRRVVMPKYAPRPPPIGFEPSSK